MPTLSKNDQLFRSRILPSGAGSVLLPRPNPKPKPGQYYTIKFGDALFRVAQRAYGSRECKGSVHCAKKINNHPYNRRFWRPAPKSEKKWFPNGRISFNPRFTGDVKRQAISVVQVPSGRSFATIFIPYL